MSATFTWVIESMQCKPTEGSYTDVVITANWRCNGVQSTYQATAYGSAVFSQPAEGGSFTPYDQLTQAQVLGWCYANGVDQTATEASLQNQIDNLINPPVVQLPLPWVTPAA